MRMPLALTLLTLAGAAPMAAAQTRHDSSAPLDFDAAHQELDDKAQRAILTGGVVIRQAEMTLRAARVNVSFTGSAFGGKPEATRVDAAGGVTLTRPDQRATANYAIYDIGRRTITMLGNVGLVQKDNNISGGRLIINLDTGRAVMDGSAVGGGVPGSVTTGGGRVTGRFTVPKRDANNGTDTSK
jgi:lipopolysaccharide export system protein LptA